MRAIGNLSEEAQARAFSDFLTAKGVRNEIERDGDGAWSLWVRDENQLLPAQEWLARFRDDPSAAEFRNASTEAARVRLAEARDLEKFHRRFRTRQSIFPDSARQGAGLFTYALIVACVAVGLFSKLGYDEPSLRFLFISFPGHDAAGFLPEVRAGEVWRLFTPVLIHFGPVHLLFNMLWLFQLGSLIENRQGHVRMALLTLGIAVVSNLAQYAVSGPAFGGMSGVVYGLFGYIWLRGRLDPRSGLFVDRQNVILMVVWFFLCMMGWVGHVANVVHGVGLALGAGCGCVSGLLARSGRR